MANPAALAYTSFIAAAARQQLAELQALNLPARKLYIPMGLNLNHVKFAWNGAMQVNRLGLTPALHYRSAPRKIPNSGWGPFGKKGGSAGLLNYWRGANFIAGNNTYLCWFKETRTISVGSYSPPICMVGWHTGGVHGIGLDGGYLKVGNGGTTTLRGFSFVADGKWHLAAFVNAGAGNKYDLYVDVNGVMTKQNGATPWSPPYASGLSMIGMGYNYSGSHTGPQDVAGWRVFGASLTLAQLQEIYLSEMEGVAWTGSPCPKDALIVPEGVDAGAYIFGFRQGEIVQNNVGAYLVGHTVADPKTGSVGFDATRHVRFNNLAGGTRTFVSWYRGRQPNASNKYSPAVPIFGEPTNSVYYGLGIDGGYPCVANGGAQKSPNSVIDGQWQMIFWKQNGANIEIWQPVNGVVSLTKAAVAVKASAITAHGWGYTYTQAEGPAELENGMVFDTLLTQAQMQELYNAQKPV